MNDEPSSSSAVAASTASSTYDSNNHGYQPTAAVHSDIVLTSADIAERHKKNRENFNRRRVELLDDLIQCIDFLVYAELSAIYYMDCSFLRFLLRALIQLLFITPKPAVFPEPPGDRPYVGALLGSNLLCILLHTFLGAPTADDATRGYLHGGMAMDFIGQRGPSSKIWLVLLDAMVVLLQIVQLSAHVLRRRLKDTSSPRIAVTTASGNQYAAAPLSNGQTVEDEERGVRRSAEAERQGDIEMQTLNPEGQAPIDEALAPSMPSAPNQDRHEELLASTAAPEQSHAHIFNAFNSGQIVIADINLFATVSEQFWAYQKAPRDINSAESSRLLRERFTRGVLRWPFGSPVAARTLG